MQQADLNFKTSFITQQVRMTLKLFRQNLESVKKNLTMQSFLYQQDEKRDDTWKGILSGLAAAFTEAAMYFAVRGADRPNPFYSVLQLYPGALALLVPFLLFQNHIPDTRPNIIASLFSFNSIIGFFGYALRFYLIPRIPTIVFSVLSFFGVLASFLWGALFVNEKPNGVTLSGAALIVLSSAGLTFLKGYT